MKSEGELHVGQKSPHQIIVVEDNPADTLLLRHALDQQPDAYALQVLQDGESALKYVRDHCALGRPEPCLIILDLHLPKYDGATVLREIRSHPELASVRVVVLTTMGSPAEKAEVLALGVDLLPDQAGQLGRDGRARSAVDRYLQQSPEGVRTTGLSAVVACLCG